MNGEDLLVYQPSPNGAAAPPQPTAPAVASPPATSRPGLNPAVKVAGGCLAVALLVTAGVGLSHAGGAHPATPTTTALVTASPTVLPPVALTIPASAATQPAPVIIHEQTLAPAPCPGWIRGQLPTGPSFQLCITEPIPPSLAPYILGSGKAPVSPTVPAP